jgi:hypothetical protein
VCSSRQGREGGRDVEEGARFSFHGFGWALIGFIVGYVSIFPKIYRISERGWGLSEKREGGRFFSYATI